MEYERTIRKLVCCATPGGCIACPLMMATDGCERRIMKEAAKRMRNKAEYDKGMRTNDVP